jgi:hypothetical protein
MLEDGGGLQATLDDVCKMPKGDDKVLLERLSSDKKLMGTGYLQLPKKRDGTFIVLHYAGAVAYMADGFCERNKDILPASAVVLVQASKDKLLSALFQEMGDTGGGSSRGRGAGGAKGGSKSVSATFKADLNGLMEQINASGPHFVRCINPNRHKQAQVFEDVKAVEQLRCGGVIEAMRMARASFPCRYQHQEFASTYVPFLCPDVAAALPARSKCLACFKALEATPGHFAVGKTLVLMRREVLDEAERRRGAVLYRHAVTIQSAARVLAAAALLRRRRKERQDAKDASVCICKLQGVCRRVKVRGQYIRMVGIARASSDHYWGGPVETAASVPEACEVAARASAHLGTDDVESAVVVSLAEVHPIVDDLAGDTEEETEGSMTARTQGSESSNTEPPSVASEDEAGMLERLRAMGIGEEAVGHVMWVADSAGGITSAGIKDHAQVAGKDPPVVDGLVPLRAGRVHWAGCDFFESYPAAQAWLIVRAPRAALHALHV